MSDTHGKFPIPLEEDFDVIVHSGDMLPNRTYGNRFIEPPFQTSWLETEAPKIHPRYWTKPMLVTPGNHDFIDAVPILQSFGIDAKRLCDESVTIDGVTFYGFPWTPQFYDWNWMCGSTEMKRRLDAFLEFTESNPIDVLVSHGPIYGVLDRNDNDTRCGCMNLRKTLQSMKKPPRLLLHGHIHESAGYQEWSRVIGVSNAACTQRIVVL